MERGVSVTQGTTRDEFGRLGHNAGFLAARFSYFAARLANRTLAPYDLRTRSYSLLELASTGAGMSQRELGRALCLDPSHIVRLVDELVGRGLVERTRDARDGRVAIIRATPAGLTTASQASEALEASYAEWIGSLDDLDAAEAVRILRPLALELG
ncbi:MarR family winged helix-turn-helix transcriptional regulator [Agromyces bauzanensis]